MDVVSMLNLAKGKAASDLHLVASSLPVLRVNGSLEPLDGAPPLTADDVNEAFLQLTTPEERVDFHHRLELDFGCSLPDIGRIRCNAAQQRGTISLVIRLLASTIPTIDDLGLPQVCKQLALKSRGLVVISGSTGSGKSTTLAAMVQHLNTTESRRVITIEDPIEYVYTNLKCTITQRELGSDTLSFTEALRHVLRQDPDVILLGEMRDLETAASLLTIAETGHLVLTTGHASSASQAIERIIGLFPSHERPFVQGQLASTLLGVLCQTLVPRADVSGMIAAVEVMLANSPVKSLIREGKIYQLPNVIRTHAQLGMELLDQSLFNLYRKGVISYENLLAFCNDQNEVERLLGNTEVE